MSFLFWFCTVYYHLFRQGETVDLHYFEHRAHSNDYHAVICHAKKELLDDGQKQAMGTMLMNGEPYNDYARLFEFQKWELVHRGHVKKQL